MTSDPKGCPEANSGLKGGAPHRGDPETVSTDPNYDESGAPDANYRNQIGASDTRVDAGDTNDPDRGHQALGAACAAFGHGEFTY